MLKFLLAVTLVTTTLPLHAAGTLAAVKQRGYVRCGVNTGLPGFFRPQQQRQVGWL